MAIFLPLRAKFADQTGFLAASAPDQDWPKGAGKKQGCPGGIHQQAADGGQDGSHIHRVAHESKALFMLPAKPIYHE